MNENNDGDRPATVDLKEQILAGDEMPRNEYVTISAEQSLIMIAIEAAGTRWLWRGTRKAAFETAIQKADLLIGDVV